MPILHGGVILPGSNPQFTENLGSPAAAGATAVHVAVADTGATQVITTGIIQPDVPRAVVATPGGTTANVTAVSVTIVGTDAAGNALTEVLPAFTAGAATAVTSLNAFKSITSISQPAIGTAVTVAYGTSAKLGLPRRLSRNTISAAYLNGVREATAPTVTTDAVNLGRNTVQLASALSGTPVLVDLYDA